MASFTVIEPPADRDGERVLFLRDGFSLLAFVLPQVWLVWRRLWLEAALYLVLMLSVTLGVRQGWLPSPAIGVVSLLASLYAGLEASTLRLAKLLRHGFAELGVVQAENEAEAELRWFSTRTERVLATAVQATPSSADPAAKPEMAGPAPEPFMGLFDYSGGR